MNKMRNFSLLPLLILGLFLFTFPNLSFAAGKILPFNWDTPENADEIMRSTPVDNTTETNVEIASISILGFSPEILQSDGTWKKISSVADLKNGGQIEVGAGSGMTINFVDGSEVTISNFSIFEIQARIFDETVDKVVEILNDTLSLTEKEINLLQGKLKASIFKHFGQKFQVRTPSAVTSVRGTEFIVEYDPTTRVTNVYLYDGLVDVDNLKNKIVQLQPGEKVTVDDDGKMTLGKLTGTEWEQLTNEIVSVPESKTQTETFKWVWIIMILFFSLSVFIYYKVKRFGV